MSFFAAICTPKGVELIADGASYTPDLVMRQVRDKARRHVGDLAISSARGENEIVEALSDAVEKLLVRFGSFDAAMSTLADAIEHHRPGENTGRHFDAVIAGISETLGPIVYRWSSQDSDAGPAYVLKGSKTGYIADVEINAEQHAGMLKVGGLKARGVGLADYFRSTLTTNPFIEGAARGHFIGGHLDFLSLGPHGVHAERLHTWPDKLGERINPSVGGNVVPMNRAERRAARSKRRVA